MAATASDPRTNLAAFASAVAGPLTVPTHAADIIRLLERPTGPVQLQIIKHRPKPPFDLLAFMPAAHLAMIDDDQTDYHEGTVQMQPNADDLPE